MTEIPAPHGAASPEGSPRAKPPIPFYWWPLWMLLLALSLVVFYGILTPVWMGIRLVAWTTERSSPRSRRARAGDARASGRR